MSRRAARFTQAEVTRIIKAARDAGLSVTGVTVDSNGFTVLTAEHPADVAGVPDQALDAHDVVMARLDAIYGSDTGRARGHVDRFDEAGGRSTPAPRVDQVQKYYEQIGFDPLTMDASDLKRLQDIAEEKWKASIPGSPLNKREKKALLKFQGCKVGALIKELSIGCDSCERLEIRGFIEVRQRSSSPARIEGYILTDAGLAALKAILPQPN